MRPADADIEATVDMEAIRAVHQKWPVDVALLIGLQVSGETHAGGYLP